jgi:hypothetical protein
MALAACTPGAPTSPPETTTAPGATPAAVETMPDDTVPTAAVAAGGPPMGRYLCYLVPNYVYNGYVELQEGGTYAAGYTRGEPQTQGSYSFDVGSRQVLWNGGTYAEDWPVAYYVEPGRYPDGSERTGTGSDRDTIALKVDQSSDLLPGQETGTNAVYSYCYLEVA